jgi:hypothetical protein
MPSGDFRLGVGGPLYVLNFHVVTVRHTELTPTSFKDFLAGLTKRHHFLCQLGCRRAAPVVVIRDHSMFLGARWWIFRALRPTIIHCVQNIVGNESTRDHFAKLPLPSTKFGKTLAFNAKIRLV